VKGPKLVHRHRFQITRFHFLNPDDLPPCRRLPPKAHLGDSCASYHEWKNADVQKETLQRDPTPLPGGREIVTLHDAADYIVKLPKAEQDFEEWQAAVEALLLVVELDGPTMMARIGIMKGIQPRLRSGV
jgi:hypothetical protein